MGKFNLYGYMYVDSNSNEEQIIQLATYFVYHLEGRQAPRPILDMSPVYEDDIKLMEVPERPIIKMTKSEYVDNFFETGSLQLGSFEYYANHENDEVRDKLEGDVVLIAQRDNFTAAGRFGGGFDHYIFCTFLGDPDPEVLAKFGYDSGFIITDPDGFAKAIKKTLGAKKHEYAACRYNHHKVLRGLINPNFDMMRIDHRTIEMLGTARHFIKPSEFAHQSEFRFTWKMPQDVSQPIIVTCPEAIQFCERLPS